MHRMLRPQGLDRRDLRCGAGGGGPAEEGAVLKDNDLARPLRLARASALEAIGAQVDADVSFLAAHGLMDYSLLVGVSRPRLEQPHTPTSPGGEGSSPVEFRLSVRRLASPEGGRRGCDDVWTPWSPPSPWADRADGGAEGAVATTDGTEIGGEMQLG